MGKFLHQEVLHGTLYSTFSKQSYLKVCFKQSNVRQRGAHRMTFWEWWYRIPFPLTDLHVCQRESAREQRSRDHQHAGIRNQRAASDARQGHQNHHQGNTAALEKHQMLRSPTRYQLFTTFRPIYWFYFKYIVHWCICSIINSPLNHYMENRTLVLYIPMHLSNIICDPIQ